MNGVHDMGGMHGMGPIVREDKEPVFHAEWERRTFALNVLTGYLGKWNIDGSRFSREMMPPAEYLATGYYEHWLWGLQFLLEQAGLVTRAEIDARMSGHGGRAAAPSPKVIEGVRVLRAAELDQVLRRGKGARVDADIAPRFKPGDRVLTRNIQPTGHTRLPRYARGRRGVIDRDYGVWVFPDTSATGEGKKPQHVYSVRFEARELWGPSASPRDSVYLDLWDDYLDLA
jgi:nitrile hydratase